MEDLNKRSSERLAGKLIWTEQTNKQMKKGKSKKEGEGKREEPGTDGFHVSPLGELHGPECKCEGCRDGIEAVIAKERESMKAVGWYAHCVETGDNTPFGFNYHTHGFPKTYHCPDMQICLPLSMEVCHGIMWRVVEMMKEGKRFEPGEYYSGILSKDLKVQFIYAVECGREVLRMILPDKHGRWDDEDFKLQFDKLDNYENNRS